MDDGPYLASAGDEFYTHFTMECGNDNLMGRVPEPSQIALLLTAFFGMMLFKRRNRKE